MGVKRTHSPKLFSLNFFKYLRRWKKSLLHWVPIFRNGQQVSNVNVPYAGYFNIPICDKPGSVYVWTDRGVQHLIEKPIGSGQYTLTQTLYPVAADGSPLTFHFSTRVWFSANGFLVTRASAPSLHPKSPALILMPISQE